VITLEELNRLPPKAFVDTLAAIFEHSPWIPQRAAERRPFSSRLQLLDAMRAIVQAATSEQQLGLINAHPKLGARGRPRQQLTQASSREQKRAGLDLCNDQEYARLEGINAAYLAKFGFPFILAVRGHDPPSIIAQMQRRLEHDRAQETRSALHQIGLIAGYRLAETVASNPAAEAQAMLERLCGSDAVSLLYEWMRAAALTVWSDGGDNFLGTLPGKDPQAGTLIVGLHHDPASPSLSYDGQYGWTCALAVAQHLREGGEELPFDLAIFARPNDSGPGTVSSLVLQQAGLMNAVIAEVPRILPASHGESALQFATRALQEFLLHTQCHG
jgi:N-carbamoyl-L-amino-acid hydrolase